MRAERARLAFDVSAWITGVAMAVFLVVDALAAERAPAPPPNATYAAECGSCHVAYPPRLLSASAWTALMQDTDRHFGVDASTDPASTAVIRAYLEANASSPGQKRYDATATRITQARWFRKEHGEIGADVWRRASVGSAANCSACHPGAERGQFNEHDVRIPRT